MTLDHDRLSTEEMEAQKTRARNAAAVEATDWVTVAEGEQQFVGYDLHRDSPPAYCVTAR